MQANANFVGETSTCLWDALDQLGVPPDVRASWYVTNLVKWPPLSRQSDSLPSAWKQDCDILLHQELRLVRPSTSSAWAAKPPTACWAHARRGGYGRGRGRIYLSVFVRGESPCYQPAKVMTVRHPAAVHRRLEVRRLQGSNRPVLQFTNGADIGGREPGLRHVNVDTDDQLRPIVDGIRTDPDPAADHRRGREGEGRHPTEPGAYLHTVQFSNRHGEAFVVVFRHRGGDRLPALDRPCSRRTESAAGARPGNGLVAARGGHFFRGDLPW